MGKNFSKFKNLKCYRNLTLTKRTVRRTVKLLSLVEVEGDMKQVRGK